MSHFAPHLIPGPHMIDALVSEDEFHKSISKLDETTNEDKRIGLNIIYVRDHQSVIIMPIRHLINVIMEGKRVKWTFPKYHEYLVGLEKEWLSIVSKAAIAHPLCREIFNEIPKAFDGEHPRKPPPAWIKYFSTTITTGDDDVVHVPTHKDLVEKDDESIKWGVSKKTAADYFKVLEILGYPPRLRLSPGVKRKKEKDPTPD